MALSDTELILQAQDGSSSAFEELVYRYDRHVLSIALKYSGDEDDAKDIYQEVFIRVYKALKNFRFQSEFSTWLFRITTNVCLTYKSRQSKRVKISLSYSDEEPDKAVAELKSGEESQPDEIFGASELSFRVEKALELLSPKQKYCFTLKHFQGYKIREIAHMMDCKEGTVKKYLFDAIRKLRLNIKEYSHTE
jgi:RNA polymerase sigma-70 factor, ECF subfamily